MLLTVLNETQPMLDNPPHVDKLSPSIEHLCHEVTFLALGMHFPSTNSSLENIIPFLLSFIRDIIDLPLCEALIFHEFFQVEDIHLTIQDILNDWTFFIDFNQSLLKASLMFPLIECESKVFDEPVTEDNSSLALNGSDFADLVSVVVHVGQQSPSIVLQEDARKCRSSNSLLLSKEVILG